MARKTPQAPPAFPSIPIGAAINANEVSKEDIIDLFGKERAEQMTREIPHKVRDSMPPPMSAPIAAETPESVVVPDVSQAPSSGGMSRLLIAGGCAVVLGVVTFVGAVVLAGLAWFFLAT